MTCGVPKTCATWAHAHGTRPVQLNHRRLRELVAELEQLSLAITETDPRWNR